MKDSKLFTFNNIGIKLSFFILATVLSFYGCKNNNPVTPVQSDQATTDAATAIAGEAAYYNGGLLDQVADLLNTPTTGGLQDTGSTIAGFQKINNVSGTVPASYDSTSGWWTDLINRTRSGVLWYSHYIRTYMHQFLDKNGNFQKYYIDAGNHGDTAYTVNHQIVNGIGQFNNLWLSHTLTSITCKWTATGTNTATVTINTTAPYIRTAIDTIIGLNRANIRTLNHTLTINFVNITGPRGTGLNWLQKTGGTLTGTFHATVTFQKGATYSETTIDRSFTITLGGTYLIITINGKTFQADPNTGQIQ